MLSRFAALSLVVTLQCAPAFAGPVADFEEAFGEMYATYRAALFATNSGDSGKSAKAVNGLNDKWGTLVAAYAQTPPPQYEDDPLWGQTLTQIGGYVEKAKTEVMAGQLPASHETLEAVRDEIGDLHARNGIETFSDRMNAYHAEMEHVLEVDMSDLDTATAQTLLERAAVLSYLATDVLQAPPAQAKGNAEYETLAKTLQFSVDRFVAAARSGEPEALKAAVGGLKVPYSKLFLKFG